MLMRCSLAFLLACLSLATAARADEVILKNGNRFRGRVVSESEKAVVIELVDGGCITLARRQISEVTAGKLPMKPVLVLARDGNRRKTGVPPSRHPPIARVKPATPRATPYEETWPPRTSGNTDYGVSGGGRFLPPPKKAANSNQATVHRSPGPHSTPVHRNRR